MPKLKLSSKFLKLMFYFFAKVSYWAILYTQLSRCYATKGSSTRFFLVGPTKFEARKSFLFTEKFPWVENKEHF